LLYLLEDARVRQLLTIHPKHNSSLRQQQQLVCSQLKVVPLALISSSHQSPFDMSPSIQRKNQHQMQHTQQMQMNHIRIYTPPPSPSSTLSASCDLEYGWKKIT
jgi:hypothetical protein